MRATANNLHEFGRLAKYEMFCKEWKKDRQNFEKLENEIDRLRRADAKIVESRTVKLSPEQNIMVEMYGAFMVFAEVVCLGKSQTHKKSVDELLRIALGEDDDEEEDEDEEEDDGLTEEEREERREAFEKQNMLFGGGTSKKSKYKKPTEIPEEPPDELIGRYGMPPHSYFPPKSQELTFY